jgi:hypothetical protein
LLYGHNPSHWPIFEISDGDPRGLKHSEYPHRSRMAAPSTECHSCQIALFEALKPFLNCYFSSRVFSVYGTNVSGGLCSFGASIELIKTKVLEMFIFLSLTLQGFGLENFVPLVQIRIFQKGLI